MGSSLENDKVQRVEVWVDSLTSIQLSPRRTSSGVQKGQLFELASIVKGQYSNLGPLFTCFVV